MKAWNREPDSSHIANPSSHTRPSYGGFSVLRKDGGPSASGVQNHVSNLKSIKPLHEVLPHLKEGQPLRRDPHDFSGFGILSCPSVIVPYAKDAEITNLDSSAFDQSIGNALKKDVDHSFGSLTGQPFVLS